MFFNIGNIGLFASSGFGSCWMSLSVPSRETPQQLQAVC
jgi:hypothetical protein